jgi:hypothetical protein
VLAQLLGDDTDNWRGHSITLFATEVSFGGEQVPAVRIRTTSRRPVPRTGGWQQVMPLAGSTRLPAAQPVEPNPDEDESENPF